LLSALRLLAVLAVVAVMPASQHGVNPLLPWHEGVVDSRGRLLAWYQPGRNLGYDHVLRLGWSFLERRVPIDRRSRLKVYLAYPVFDGRSLQGVYWQHNPAFLYASLVDSAVAWYPYSGDRRAIAVVRTMLDHQLAHGTTPAGWAWPGVPFATACAGEREYGRCLADAPRRFYGGIEPDKVGLLGFGYLRFYELTGDRRYLRAALAAADALGGHVRTGDAGHTPWPFRVDARTGNVIGGAAVGPLTLFDELVRLGTGDTKAYERAAALVRRWLLRYPLNRASTAWNRWAGFYEDVAYNPRSRNQASALLTAHYLLTRTAPASVDPAWRAHVGHLLDWVRSSFGRGPFLGAWGIDEQRAPGRPGCCSRAGLGSDTSRWGAVGALLFARTGDPAARERAFRALNYATYFARADGRVSCCGVRPRNEFWFSDGYGDYLRSFSWAMAAIPELAPVKADHLLGSSSVVQAVSYGRRRIAYRTFDTQAVEVLRLSYPPARILVNGRALPRRSQLDGEGYVIRRLSGADTVVRIRHDRSQRVLVEG
jgi:hypothetical protein